MTNATGGGLCFECDGNRAGGEIMMKIVDSRETPKAMTWHVSAYRKKPLHPMIVLLSCASTCEFAVNLLEIPWHYRSVSLQGSVAIDAALVVLLGSCLSSRRYNHLYLSKTSGASFVIIQIDAEFKDDSVSSFIVSFHYRGQIWALERPL
jgi:hypothetical protein